MSFLTSIGIKAWGYIATAGAVVLGLFVALGKAKQAGRDEVKAKVNEATADANKRMLDAAVQSPKEIDDVRKDLRNGRF